MRLYIVFFICLLVSVTFAAAKASAREFFSPSIETAGQYNDNIFFSSKDKENDFIVKVTPALDMKLSTERFSLSAAPKYSYLHYMDNTDSSRSIEKYNVEATALFTQRISLQTTAEYKKDSTQESEQTETGSVSQLYDRYRSFWSGNMIFDTSEKSNLSLSYSHTSTSYQWGKNIDWQNDGVVFSGTRALNDEKTKISAELSLSMFVSSVNKTSNYGTAVSLSQNFTERTAITASIGARRTIIDQNAMTLYREINGAIYSVQIRDEETFKKWGGLLNFEVTSVGQTFSTTFGYSRDLSHNSSGEPIERDQLHVSTRMNTSESSSLDFRGQLGQTRSESGDSENKKTYFTLRPSLIYKLTKDATANLWYQYSYNKNAIDNGDWVGARNLICLTCRFNFPKQM